MFLKFIFSKPILLLLLLLSCTPQTPTNPVPDPNTPVVSSTTNATISSNTTSSNTTSSTKPLLICQQTLLQSYGLTGFPFPVQTYMPFCPGIKSSCCTAKDGLRIYEYWVGDNTAINLQNKMKYYQSVYQDLAITMTRVSDFAAKLNSNLIRSDNCKILSNSIKEFPIKDIAPRLRDLLTQYFSFHQQQFNGFYCTICDARSAPFVDLKRKAVKFSAPFCRGVVMKSLQFLLYFHVNFAKILNLMVNFAQNCDASGVYKFLPVQEHNFRIHLKKRRVHQLMRCKKNVNLPTWLRSCVSICKRMSLVNFRRYFRPRVQKYQRITIMLNEKMQIAENQIMIPIGVGLDSNSTSSTSSAKRERILADNYRHPKTRFNRRRRRLQMSGVSTLTSSYYASMIVTGLQKSLYRQTVIEPSIGHAINLARFVGVVDDPLYLKQTAASLAAMNDQLAVLLTSSSSSSGQSPAKISNSTVDASDVDGLDPVSTAGQSSVIIALLPTSQTQYLLEMANPPIALNIQQSGLNKNLFRVGLSWTFCSLFVFWLAIEMKE